MARADMESADSAAPIVASGKRAAAGRVIGVRGCGDDPVCHDGRSISEQGSGWEGLLGWAAPPPHPPRPQVTRGAGPAGAGGGEKLRTPPLRVCQPKDTRPN